MYHQVWRETTVPKYTELAKRQAFFHSHTELFRTDTILCGTTAFPIKARQLGNVVIPPKTQLVCRRWLGKWLGDGHFKVTDMCDQGSIPCNVSNQDAGWCISLLVSAIALLRVS